MKGFDWTATAIARLRELIEVDRCTASQAAEFMAAEFRHPGITKNSIIGKANRIGLIFFRNPGKDKFAPKTIAKRKPPMPLLAMIAVSAPPPPITAPPQDVEIVSLFGSAAAAGISKLTRSNCHWPIGNPMSDDFSFCGTTAAAGRQYCPHHMAIAYRPARTKTAEIRVAAQ